MVPPLVTASRSAPGRPLSTSRTRSHTIRGRSSANSSLGYRPASMSSTARRVASPSPENGDARRTTADSSSSDQSSTATIATICCARTSSGLRGIRMASSAPSRMRCAVTAAGTSSPRNVGNTIPRDTAPTWCPARPTRCSPLATDGGDPTCTTRSMAPMSMPSSSELVATTAGSSPALSSDSVRVRSARLIEPWCARARMVAACRVSMPTAVPDCAGTAAARSVAGSGTSSPERSAQTSFIRAVRRSAPRRELVNTSVDRCSATRSTTRSSTCGQIDGRGSGPAAAPDRSRSSGVTSVPRRSDRSGTGTTTSTTIFLVDGGWTTVTARPRSSGLRAPPRNSATASTGRTVADSPIRWAGPGPPGWSSRASSRSSDTARWAPRLVPATAWISSTITVRTPASPARAPDVRTR